MFDCVSGGGFSSRCKSRIKLIRTRINVIKKRRSDTIGYLKNAMAELLKNGLDINAYGRAEGLITELNHLACYELIEQFCMCILAKLSSMRKQRDCPPETKEAVSTLMFAAARFADLPELCDLRCIFTQRYESAIESAISREFAEKFESKTPSMDQKLQLMRNIARDFSVNWDCNAFRDRISNPITFASDGVDKFQSLGKRKDGAIAKMDKDDVFTNVKISSQDRQRTPPRHEKQHTPPRHEVKTDGSRVIVPITDAGYDRQRTPPRHEKQHTPPRRDVKIDGSRAIVPITDAEYERQRTPPRHAKQCTPPRHEVKRDGSRAALPIMDTRYERQHTPPRHEVKSDDSKVILPITKSNNDCPPFGSDKLGYKESAENLKPHYSNNVIPPYVKPRGSNYGTDMEICYADSDHSRPIDVSIGHRGIVAGNREEKIQVGLNLSIREKPLARSNGSGDENACNLDDSAAEAHLKLRSVRRKKQLKLLAHENYATTEDSGPPNRNPNGRRSRGTRRGIRPPYDDDLDEEDMIMDELLIHYSKKSTDKKRRPPKGLKAPSCAASDGSKSPLHRNNVESHSNSESSFPTKGPRSHARAADASKSPLHQNKEEDHLNSGLTLTPARVASLPSQRTTPTEVNRPPVRAISLEPNMLRPHVHPKLPDYDDLAARIAALREEMRK